MGIEWRWDGESVKEPDSAETIDPLISRSDFRFVLIYL